MVQMTPISTIKRLAVAVVKAPVAAAGAVVGVVQAATRRVRGADREQPVAFSPDQPVNVTEELGLDPAPVAKPRPRKTPAPPPVTGIDAGADPDHVEATPADVAEAMKKD